MPIPNKVTIRKGGKDLETRITLGSSAEASKLAPDLVGKISLAFKIAKDFEGKRDAHRARFCVKRSGSSGAYRMAGFRASWPQVASGIPVDCLSFSQSIPIGHLAQRLLFRRHPIGRSFFI